MSSWLTPITDWTTRISQSRNLQLATTAIVSGVLVGGTILGAQAANQRRRTNRLKNLIPPQEEQHDPIADKVGHYI